MSIIFKVTSKYYQIITSCYDYIIQYVLFSWNYLLTFQTSTPWKYSKTKYTKSWIAIKVSIIGTQIIIKTTSMKYLR